MQTSKLDRKARKLLKLGWLITLLLAAWALFSPWGAIRHYQLSKSLEQIEEKNMELRDSNRQLREEIEHLNNDPDYIEKVARTRHGLLRTNEFVYQFPNKKK